jgi:WD40 repeat protein
MLSQVLIVTGKLDHATMSCQNNYYERRKLLGKDNMKCYESLALLSRIHKLTGNDREAIRYISIIPDEIQGSACQSFSTLWPPVERQWSDFKKLYVPVIRLQLQLRYRPSAVFSHDSRLLVCTAGDTYGVQIWDVASGAKRMDLHGSNNELLDIAISRDCEFVAAVNMERVVLLWDVMANDAPTRCRAHTADTGFYPESVAFSFDGKVLVLDWNPSLKQRAVTDILSGHNLITIPKQDGPSGRCATPLVFPNGKWLASTATNGTVTLWNLASYKLAQKLDGQYEITTQMSVSANGRRLALLSGNTSVRLWDIARGTVIKRLELGAPGTSIVFSAHLDLLAHGPHREDQTTLRVIESGSEVSLPGSFVAFSPDNQVVVVMNNVGNTALWQIESLRSHPGSQGQKPRPEAHALKAAKAAIPKQEQARSRHNVSPSKFTISNLFKRKST